MAKSQEIAKVEQTPAVKTFMEAAKSMMAEDASGEDMMLGVLTATNIDEILGSGDDVIHLQDIIGKPFTIIKGTLRESDYAEGLPAYLVMDVKFDDDTTGVVTTGAATVLSQVIRMNELGFLPYRVSSVQASKPTKKGFYPISLCKADPIPEQF